MTTTTNTTLPIINERILHALFFTPTPNGWGISPLLWGDPGVGKTHMVKAAAAGAELPCVRLSPAERGEGQFGVIAVPRESEHGLRLVYPVPDFADDLADGGVIFVDEMNLGGHALQAPLLGLIQLRTLGSHQFGPRVRTLGACNETADAPGAADLANSLRNRFAHFRYEGLDANAWAAALLQGFRAGAGTGARHIDSRAEEARVMAAWPLAYGKAAAIVGGFLSRRPDLLHVKPARGSKAMSYPTRRTWEYATLALASASVHSLSESDTDAILVSLVGLDAVSEFATWRGSLDLPDAIDLLDGKVTWKHEAARPDRTNVVLGSIVGYLSAVEPTPARLARAEVAWALIGDVLDVAADLAYPAAQGMFTARLTYPTVRSAEARKVQAKITPIDAAIRAAQAKGLIVF